MSISTRALAAAVAACILAPVPAHAAGFAIFEQGARGMGFAGAFTAQANDPSAIFHNAAGIAFLKGKQIYLGGTLIRPSTTFTGADPFPGASVTEKGDTGLLVPPAAYYTQQFSERLVFGIGLHTPFGLTTVLGQPGHLQRPLRLPAGRAEGASPSTRPRLQARRPVRDGRGTRRAPLVRIAPAARARDQSLHAARDRRSHRRSFEATPTSASGFNVGALAKISDSLSAGVHYRHQVKASYDGVANFTQIATGNAQLDTVPRPAPAPGQPGRDHRASCSPGSSRAASPTPRATGPSRSTSNWYQWSKFSQLRPRLHRPAGPDRVHRRELRELLAVPHGAGAPPQRDLGRARRVLLRSEPGARGVDLPAPARRRPQRIRPRRHLEVRTLPRGCCDVVLLSPARSTEGLEPRRVRRHVQEHAVTLGIFLGYSF